jgi:glycosyltransferase involved in cell wall biosynthesis
MPATVSILMATRDNLATLPKALEVFLASPLRPEIVIVNDGSTDGTAAYLGTLPRDRVKAIQLPESGGLTKALNLAFRESAGTFLARQDADDASHPGRLEAQLAAFGKDPGLDILGTGHRVVDGNGSVLAELPGRNFARPAKRLLRDNFFCHGSLMFRRQSLERLGGYREFFRLSQDYDLLLRAAGAGLRLANLRACLYDWTFSPRAVSLSKAREQALYGETAKRTASDPGLDPAACYRDLQAQEARDTGPAAALRDIPPEWQLMKILLLAGDTAGARRQYRAMRDRGVPIPRESSVAALRHIPGWLYRPMRALGDLRYT